MRSRFRGSIPLLSAVLILIGFFVIGRRTGNAFPQASPTTKESDVKNRLSEAYRLNTLGVAYLNQQRPAEAQKYFEQALEANPYFAVGRLNLGVSLLAQQKLESASAALEKAAQALPGDPYAWYNLGLVLKDLGEAEKGIAAFQHVTEITQEADAYYFIGYLNTQLQRYDEAIAAFQKGLALSSYHASSEFGIARAYQRRGDAASAREHLARFQKITSDHLGSPFGAGYGDQGRLSLAELPLSNALEVPSVISVHYKQVVLGEPTSEGSAQTTMALPGASAGACFFDYDGDGHPDLFLVSATRDGYSRLLHNLGDGKFADVTRETALNLKGSGLGCAAGDYDNDSRTDLAVCLSDGVHLLHNRAEGLFEDVTKDVGIRLEPGCVGLTFVDYDHDGDLDLYVTSAPNSDSSGSPHHNILWRNNGNSTFTDVSSDTALGIESTGAGVVTTDFNNDRAIDFVIAGGKSGASILLNPREGKFMPLTGIDFAKENLPPAVGVIAFDFNKDGWMDLAFTHAGKPAISLWRNVEGRKLERVTIPENDWTRAWGLASFDYDNDGWLDLIVAGESSGAAGLTLLRNLGPKGWTDVTKETQLDAATLNQPRAIAVPIPKGKEARIWLLHNLAAGQCFSAMKAQISTIG
jgi:tetratricopeptide (TPR) repeat protein